MNDPVFPCLLRAAFAVVLASFAGTAFADTEVVDGVEWTFTVSGEEAVLGSLANPTNALSTGITGAIIIPSVLGGRPVRTIASRAFTDCKVESVVIPEGVTNIADEAFYDAMKLASVSFPDGLTSIGTNAFYRSRLSSVSIPGTVKTIGDVAFQCCWYLEEVSLSEGTESIGRNAFYNSNIDSIVIPDSVTALGAGAFESCYNLVSATVGRGVASIEADTFSGCWHLDSVRLLGAVTNIGDRAFASCSLTDFSIPADLVSIGERAFGGCGGLTSVTIPAKVSFIGAGAFSGCSGLSAFSVAQGNTTFKAMDGTLFSRDGSALLSFPCGRTGSFTIPSSVKTIAEKAFFGSRNLTGVTIPTSVVTIGDSAFYGCYGLTGVTIPTSVVTIGDSAFCGCNGLTAVAIPTSVVTIGDSAFQSCGLRTVAIPSSVKNLGKRAFAFCAYLQSASLEAGLKAIPDGLFEECYFLKSFDIPVGVERVGDSAFKYCDYLERVSFPDGLKSIGDRAFSEDWNLASVSFPDSLLEIGDEAFYRCSGLTEVVLPDGLERLGGWAFSYCGRLSTFVLPALDDADLSNWWFPDGCTVLLKGMDGYVALDSTWSFKVSGGAAILTGTENPVGNLAIPRAIGAFTVATVGERAFFGCDGLVSVFLPGSVERIEAEAFSGCSGLETVSFSSGLRAVGPRAFEGTALRSLVLPEGATELDPAAFDGADGLVYVVLPDGVDVSSFQLPAGCSAFRRSEVFSRIECHSGVLADDENWSADRIHVLTGDIDVPDGVSLSIDAGTVVKFEDGASLSVSDAAFCIARGVVFTHVADDTAGGDTNGDGDATEPAIGAYSVSGPMETDAATEKRWYSVLEFSGTLPDSATWTGCTVYRINGSLTIPDGTSLTIDPGAIVKFDPDAMLVVSDKGSLRAEGTHALPVVFTSIKDDGSGGDTNGDGDLTVPEPGDWFQIRVCGNAFFDHCSIRYGSSTENYGGVEAYGGTIVFRNGEIAHMLFDCVNAHLGGSFDAANSAFRDASLGLGYYGGAGVRAANCVFHDLLTAVRQADKRLVNCVFSQCRSFTDQWGDDSTFEHCAFWNPSGFGEQSFSKIGTDGNVWGDPLFYDPDGGDFRIAANSPCVDAADGAVAPERDSLGRPRMDVSSIRDTGTAAANGAVPDIGVYEVSGDAAVPAADLAVVSVAAPASLEVGGTAEIAWTVENVGVVPASGSWRDEIEIVSANGRSFRMGTVSLSAAIGSGESASFRETLRIPAAAEGPVRIRVTANKHQDLFEAFSTANNANESSAELTLPFLAVPADGSSATVFVPAESDSGFSLSVPGGGSAVLMLRGSGEFDAWLGDGCLSSRENARRTAVRVGDGVWLLQIPAGAEPRVTVANDGLSAAVADLSIVTGDFFLCQKEAVRFSNSGSVSLPFEGNGFDGSMSCWIERGGVRVDASEVLVESGVSARAVFDVTGRAAGDWTLHVRRGADEASAALLSLVQSSAGPKWTGEVDIPGSIRPGRSYVGMFRYGNEGDVAMPAPYVRLEAKGDTLVRLSEADAWAKSVEFLAASDSYPASMLGPGSSHGVSFFFKTTGGGAEIEYSCTLSSAEAFPWADAADGLRPAWASDELWGFALATLRANFGETWDSYLDRLRSDCDHLMKVGSPVKRLDRIWQLEINEALGNDVALPQLASATDLARSARGLGLSFSRSYSSSLRGRLTSGILGYGWTDNFSSYVEELNDDTLVFHFPAGGSYSFTKVSGEWAPQDARDKTQLTETSSAYILTSSSGTVQTFAKANGKTASIRDNVGNELSFTYSGGNLARLVHSDGQSLSFTYSGGKLSKAQDDQGRTVAYAYANGSLASVTAFDGLVTRYEYVSAPGTPRDKALSRIVRPDGTTTEFEYDDSGLLAATSANGGQLRTAIVRGSFGCHAVVAPNGGRTEAVVGANGETLETIDACGGTVRQTYTADSLLESTVSPSGRRSALVHDRDGNPVAATSASGATTTFSYEPEFGALASVTDAKGHSFLYDYDEFGRNVSVAYADGSAATVEYDGRGDMVRSTNRRGESVDFEYDAEGRLVKKTWPNGRTFTFAYDAKGNLVSAADSETGTVTMEYDGNERMTRIVYPKGRGFTFAYDAYGRTVERSSLDGAKECYAYDSFGRLVRVTDGDGNAYLENAYDPTTGCLVTQTYGNGTVVSNAYDVLGRTVGIYHGRAGSPGEPWLAFFEYAYDEDGRCISQRTAEGVETYAYDADGQLVAVAYPDGTSETFAYDAVGNRLDYTVNELNQYLSGNGATFTYDADGNMTSRTDVDGTTTYVYDVLNRLVAVTNETKNIRWSCEYDVFGNRTSVTDGGTTTERLFVQGSLPSVAAEYVDGSLSTRHILIGAVRLLTTNHSSLTTTYYHGDLLGSTRLLTDDTGAAMGTRSFKAFGETRTFSGEPTDAGYVGTLGIETDSTGLLFMRNRYYDAGMGRFVQMDPISLNGENVNLYVYCDNYVITDSDTLGLKSESSDFSASSFALGAARDYFLEKAPGKISRSIINAKFGSGIGSGSYIPLKGVATVNEATRITTGVKVGAGAFGLVFSGLSAYDRYQNGDSLGTTSKLLAGGLSLIPGCWWVSSAEDAVYYFGEKVFEWTHDLSTTDHQRKTSDSVQSQDPNEIVGENGLGAARYVEPGQRLTYTIYFENKAEATAAAQEIFVDLPMDPNLDWTTLELGEIVFGEHVDTGLLGKKRGTSNYAVPGTNVSVRTKATDKGGVLSWYIRDWDPTTADNFPADACGGFLPPNDATHRGEGRVSFRVRVKADAPRGARLNASARIVFDKNPPIETDPAWWNTVATVYRPIVDLGDGTTAEVTLVVGQPYGALPTPKARAGYTFGGWYTGPNGTGTKISSTTIVEAGVTTIYPHWIPATYKVAFNANGGTLPKGKKMAAQTMTYGKAAKLRKNVFTRKGYVFAGWAVKKGGAVAFADAALVKNLRTDGKPTTLYAVWAKPTYKVQFVANGGKGTMAVQTFKYGKAAKLKANVFKAPKGKKFAGWATSKALAKKGKVAYKNKKAVKNLVTTGKTVKLYAVWKKK